MRYPHIMQHDERDCGPACLSMIAFFYGLKLPLGKVRELVQTDSAGTTIYGMLSGAKKIGLYAEAEQGSFEELKDEIKKKHIVCPLIAHIINEKQMAHFIVIYEIKENYILIGDPAKGIQKLHVKEFKNYWTGYIISIKPTSELKKGNFIKKSMKRYVHNVEKQKISLMFIILLAMCIAGINMFGTTLFEYIVDGLYKNEGDNIIRQNKKESIIAIFFKIIPSFEKIFFLVIYLYVIQSILQYIRGVISIEVTKRINLPVTLQYYTKLTKLPLSFFSGRKLGELITRFSDASNVCQMIVDTIFTVFVDGLLVVFYAIFLYVISPRLFLMVVGLLLSFIVIVWIFKKRFKYLEMASMEKNANVNSYLKESLEGIETVKNFNMEKIIRSKTIKKVNESVEINCMLAKLNNLKGTITSCIVSIGIVLLLWRGMIFVCRGELSIGNLITFYTILGSFFTPIQNIIDLQMSVQNTFIVADRLNDVMELSIEDEDTESKIDEDSISFLEDIDVNNVTFRYGTRQAILQRVNFHICRGQKIAIVGESGSGKSTLAKILAGIFNPEDGEIYVGRFNLEKFSGKYIRKHVTYITQDVYLFSGTIRENLEEATMALDKDLKEIEESELFKEKFPFGLDTIIEENGRNLSGGQKQLIAFIRALLQKPEILILDEVTSNLDAITEKSILEYLNNLKITRIFITHRLSSIIDYDEIFFMKDGRIVDNGKHRELLSRCKDYRRMSEAYGNENDRYS